MLVSLPWDQYEQSYSIQPEQPISVVRALFSSSQFSQRWSPYSVKLSLTHIMSKVVDVWWKAPFMMCNLMLKLHGSVLAILLVLQTAASLITTPPLEITAPHCCSTVKVTRTVNHFNVESHLCRLGCPIFTLFWIEPPPCHHSGSWVVGVHKKISAL